MSGEVDEDLHLFLWRQRGSSLTDQLSQTALQLSVVQRIRLTYRAIMSPPPHNRFPSSLRTLREDELEKENEIWTVSTVT